MPAENTRGRPALLLGGLVALAAGVRIWALDFGLPHTQARPDETFIISLAFAMLNGQTPPPYYEYPWFFAYLSALVYVGYYVWGTLAGTLGSLAEMTASYEQYWQPFFVLNRTLSALSGAATVIVVYAIGCRLKDTTAGLAAALFLALAHIHAQNSHFGTTDVTLTFFIMLSVALLLRAHESGRTRDFISAGVAGGLAAATKYNGVLLALPMLLSHALLLVDSPGRRLSALTNPRTILLGVSCLLAFLVGVPFVFYDFDGFRVAMELLAASMASGAPALASDTIRGHYLTVALRYGLGIPLLSAGLAGAVVLPVRDPRRALLLLAFPIVYYVVAARSGKQFFRYAVPLAPFFCVTAGYLVAAVAGSVRKPLVAAAVSVAIVAPSAWSTWQFTRLLARTDNRVVVADWVAQFVPPGDSIVQSGSTYGHAQINDEVWSVWSWNPIHRRYLLNGRPPEQPPRWILVQESPLPSGTQPEIAALLESGEYDFAWQFQALTLGRVARVYDPQDAFFLPIAGFDGISRPGPNFTLYRRRDALAQ